MIPPLPTASGHECLEETIRASTTWNGLRETVQRYTQTCPQYQKFKHTKKEYGKLPEKFVVMEPWYTLCVNLIGPYTLKGQDGSEIDFMYLTMIDAATGWFEVVELPVIEKPLLKKWQNQKLEKN